MDKPTILFADNDPDFLATRSESLERAGYTVIPARNPAQAQRKLEDGGIDLAILDIRLTDDDDEKDISGLALAREVARSVPKIILTQFPTFEFVREAMRPRPDGPPAALEFVDKDEGPEALLQAINKTLVLNTTWSRRARAETVSRVLRAIGRYAKRLWVTWTIGLLLLVLDLLNAVEILFPGLDLPRWVELAAFLLSFLIANVYLFVRQELSRQTLESRLVELEAGLTAHPVAPRQDCGPNRTRDR